MATFHTPSAAPDSLENVLSSLQNVLEHSRHNSPQTAYEPFSNQPAEQYDDPLVLDEPTVRVSEILQQHIPVLNDVISKPEEELYPQPLAPIDIEKTLDTLRVELSGMVAEALIDARQQLEQLAVPSQEVLETSMKRFLQDLIDRLPS